MSYMLCWRIFDFASTGASGFTYSHTSSTSVRRIEHSHPSLPRKRRGAPVHSSQPKASSDAGRGGLRTPIDLPINSQRKSLPIN